MAYDSTIEDLVDNVESFVSANMAAYVTGINTAKGDITLEAIRSVTVGDTDPYESNVYPIVQLYPEQLEVEQISTGYDSIHMTIIGLIAIKETGTNQQKKLLRYTEALRQVLRDYVDLGESDFDVNKADMVITYYPTDPSVGVAVSTVQFGVMKEVST